MTFLRRALWLLFVLCAAGGLALKWRNPHVLLHGRTLLAWVGLAALALLGLRCALMVLEASRRSLPWTRLLLPSVILLEGAGLAWKGGASPFWSHLRLGTALLLEVALLAFAVRVWRRRRHDAALLPEDELALPLKAFLPPVLSRLLALELVMMGGALRFLAGGHRRPDPEGFSYHHRCSLKALLPALPVLIVADLAGLEFLLRNHPWIRWTVHLMDAYAILWFTGLWASFRARPHRIEGDHVILHHGILGRLEVRKDQIVAIAPPPAFKDDWARLADNRKVAQLQAPGPPSLDLQLTKPMAAMGLLGPGRPKSRVRISVDEPAAFKAALGLA